MSQLKIVTFQSLGEWGRLGNHLFQIAATTGVARQNKCAFIFPPWAYGNVFEHPLPISRSPIKGLEEYYEQTFLYQDITIAAPTTLIGHFQSEKYFAHCTEEIRHFFTLKQSLMQKIKWAYASIASGKTCSVHVRRGDYVDNPNYVDLTQTHYYETAIKQFGSDTTFLFFSDDIAWCKQRFSDKRFIFVEGFEDYADLALMSLCDGNIIANSSFSWWGAWLSSNLNKQVIAPLAWFAGEFADALVPCQPGPPDLRGFCDTKDLIPTGWVRL